MLIGRSDLKIKRALTSYEMALIVNFFRAKDSEDPEIDLEHLTTHVPSLKLASTYGESNENIGFEISDQDLEEILKTVRKRENRS